jgi:hypothetical protein
MSTAFKAWLHDKGYRAATIVEIVRLAFDFDSLGPGFTAYSGTKAYCLASSA